MKAPVKYTGIVFLVFVAALAAAYAWINYDATKLPANNPEKFAREKRVSQKGRRVVVCAGDSITHGRVSINYVDILEKRFSSREYIFINAGINSERAWNLKNRLDAIAACHPDIISFFFRQS